MTKSARRRKPAPLSDEEMARCKKSAHVLGASPAGHYMTRLIEEVERLKATRRGR